MRAESRDGRPWMADEKSGEAVRAAADFLIRAYVGHESAIDEMVEEARSDQISDAKSLGRINGRAFAAQILIDEICASRSLTEKQHKILEALIKVPGASQPIPAPTHPEDDTRDSF
jgi:hypothetical protein